MIRLVSRRRLTLIIAFCYVVSACLCFLDVACFRLVLLRCGTDGLQLTFVSTGSCSLFIFGYVAELRISPVDSSLWLVSSGLHLDLLVFEFAFTARPASPLRLALLARTRTRHRSTRCSSLAAATSTRSPASLPTTTSRPTKTSFVHASRQRVSAKRRSRSES